MFKKLVKNTITLQKRYIHKPMREQPKYEKDTADHISHNFDTDTTKPSVFDNTYFF